MNVFQTLQTVMAQSVFSPWRAPVSILSGQVGDELELTWAEQQALPWLTSSGMALSAGKHGNLWDASKVAFDYEMPVSQWIQAFKYQARIERGRLLADLFAQRFQLHALASQFPNEAVEVLLPVPIHRMRYRQRGFNQSLRLAKRLSKLSGIPVENRALLRVRNTPPQASLSAHQRQTNLTDAFALQADYLQNYRRIAVVDDVLTTGATMNALLAKIREQTNVEWVEVWAIAHTQMD